MSPSLLAPDDTPEANLVQLGGAGHSVRRHLYAACSQHRIPHLAAGAALAALHELGTGEGFGPCRRDGTCAEAWPGDARDYTAAKLRGQIERAVQGRYIHDDERATLEAACGLIAAFAGERPVPCHRDY